MSSSIVCWLFPLAILALSSVGALGQLSAPKCRTTAVENGICVTLVHCPSLISLTSTLSIAEFVRQYGCGPDSEGNSRLCCPEKEKETSVISTTPVRPIITSGGIPNIIGDCGPQVVGEGYPWPFLVAVGRFWNNNFDHNCNGAVISNHWVLVSSECILNHYISHVLPGQLLYVGQNYQYVKVIEKLHQGYTDTGRFSKGIALLKLERPLIFNDYVQAVCLPDANSGGTPTLLTALNLPMLGFSGAWSVSQWSVKGIQGTSKTCDTSNQVSSLYKAKNPVDMCAEGLQSCNEALDPLVVTEDPNTGRYQLIGIGGSSHSFCIESVNFYSSVASYIGWINEQMRRPPSSSASVNIRLGFGGSQCGKRAVGNGTDFSFMVALGRVQNGAFTIQCVGVIISESWVLTDSDCLVSSFITHVRVAVHSPNERNVPVAIRRRHESYDPSTSKSNVGLLKLETPLTLDDSAQAVCLPSTREVRKDNLIALTLEELSFPETGTYKRTLAVVDVVDKDFCVSSGSFSHSYNSDTICATGFCMDRHKNLILLERDAVTSQFTVVGVGVKSKTPCVNLVQGYTQVYPYVDWIRNNVQ